MVRKPPAATALIVVLCLVVVLAYGCGGGRETADTTTGTVSATGTTASVSTESTPPPSEVSGLQPIVVPTLPEVIPGYTELDPATGLHVTGTPQVVDFATYRLVVTGKVAKELSLTYDELRSLPKMTATPTLDCPGYFVDTVTWSGASLVTILEMAELLPDAKQIRMKSADGYSSVLSLERALQPENFLAYELMGEPLPVLHGFPLRAIIPAQTGGVWVKWLVEIEAE